MILETRALQKRFGGLVAVNNVSLAVEEGEIFGLVGPNGAGKSVFFNCIAGALRPDAGEVVIDGRNTTGWTPERMCRAGLARTFQIPRPFPSFTALQTVLVAAQFGTRSSAEDPGDIARECLEFVSFPSPPETLARNLNPVALRRLDLARALASRPRVLLLDELAAGMMTGQLGELIAIIARVRDRGTTVVMVEHVMQTILKLCDRLAVLVSGQKFAEGPTQQVARDPEVMRAYFGESVAAN